MSTSETLDRTPSAIVDSLRQAFEAIRSAGKFLKHGDPNQALQQVIATGSAIDLARWALEHIVTDVQQ